MTEIYKDGKRVTNLTIERHDVDFVSLAFTFENGTQEIEVWKVKLKSVGKSRKTPL